MNARSQLICLWSGYLFLPLYAVGFALIAGFIPIMPANLGREELAAYFDQNQQRILIGMSISVIASALLVPWCVAISSQMARIETGFRTYGHVQLVSGGIGAAFFMIPPMIWATMAFRAGHNPDTLQILNDFSWIAWIISWPFFTVQEFAIGLCALSCKTEQKIIPRWVAYLSFWQALSLVPASLVVFFKTGPFAWNGLIAVYLPLTLYVIWYHAMFFVMLKAIKGRLANDKEPNVEAQPI